MVLRVSDFLGTSEMLEFEGGISGVVLNLKIPIGAIIFWDATGLQGQTVRATGKILSVPVSADLVDALFLH